MSNNDLEILEGYELDWLYEGALNNLEDKNNDLRFHNFAYCIRAVIDGLIKKIANDDYIKKSLWYSESKEDNDKITRKDRFKFCIQKGYSDNFVNKYLLDKCYGDLIGQLIKSYNILNELNHFNEKITSSEKITELSEKILDNFHYFIEKINEVESKIEKDIEDLIDKKVIENFYIYFYGPLKISLQDFYAHLITCVPSEIDILSTRSQPIDIGSFEKRLVKKNWKKYEYEINGIVTYELDYYCTMPLDCIRFYGSFPFNGKLTIPINDFFLESIGVEVFYVDDSNRYDWAE